MGLDFLDLQFRCERAFQIKFDRQEIFELWDAGRLNPPKRLLADIKVGDFIRLVEKTVQQQNPNPSYSMDIASVVKRHISECLCVDESMVVDDAWLGRDLGLSG